MAEPKTRPTDANVEEFLAAIPNEVRRNDARVVDGLMRAASGEQPVIWGRSIVGYGTTGGDGSSGSKPAWPVVAFAARKAELVLYLNSEIEASAFDALGPHRRGVGCLYIKRLDRVDLDVLVSIIQRSVELTDG